MLTTVVHGGVCGSDLHYYREGAVGSFVLREPLVLGASPHLEAVVTRTFALRDAVRAMETAADPGVPGKVVLRLDDPDDPDDPNEPDDAVDTDDEGDEQRRVTGAQPAAAPAAAETDGTTRTTRRAAP